MLLHTIAHSAQVHREIGNSLVYFSVPTFSSPETSVGRLASAHALELLAAKPGARSERTSALH